MICCWKSPGDIESKVRMTSGTKPMSQATAMQRKIRDKSGGLGTAVVRHSGTGQGAGRRIYLGFIKFSITWIQTFCLQLLLAKTDVKRVLQNPPAPSDTKFKDPSDLGDDWRLTWGTLPPFWAKARVTLSGGHSWQPETSEGQNCMIEKG